MPEPMTEQELTHCEKYGHYCPNCDNTFTATPNSVEWKDAYYTVLEENNKLRAEISDLRLELITALNEEDYKR